MGRGRSENRDDWEDKRQEILATAVRMFADNNLELVTMRDIGQACGLHISTLYHYFPSKAALYEAAREWTYRTTTTLVLESLHRSTDPLQRVRDFADAIVNFFLSNDAAVGILERELIFNMGKDRRSITFPSFMGEPVKVLGPILHELRPGILKSMPVERLAEVLWDIAWGVCRYLPAHSAVTKRKLRDADKKDVTTEVWTVFERVLVTD